MMPKFRLPMLLSFVWLGVCGQDVLAQTSSDPRILFLSERDGNSEIYVMNGDGSGQTRLTDHGALDLEPEWSPDGSKIAFYSMRGGNLGDIFLMNADGSGVTRLTHTNDPLRHSKSPSWSPDGSTIAYTTGGGLGDPFWRVYTVNACVGDECSRLGLPSSNRPRAMAVGDELTSYTNPAWSPDGSQLAVSQLGGALFIAVQKIKVMNADGTREHDLNPKAASEDQAAWSPDGSKIAFTGYLNSGTWEIFVVNVDGSNEVRLTRNRFQDFVPTWSPDGSRIAFTSNRSGRFEIYVMNADGSDVRQLTQEGGGSPSWQRDPDVIISSPPVNTPPVDAGVQVTFTNGASVPVQLVWVGPAGQEYPAYVLLPGASRVQPSNATDLWRVKRGNQVLEQFTVGTPLEQSWTIGPFAADVIAPSGPILEPTGHCSGQPPETILTFEDGQLGQHVEAAALPYTGGTSLTCGSLSRVMYLLIEGDVAFGSLVGLQSFSDLMFLGLNGHSITDIGPLSGMTSLSNVSLADNAITDLSALSGLTDLNLLDLSRNPTLRNIQPLLDNTEFGAGDYALLQGTNVSCTDVNALIAKGVVVSHDFSPNELTDCSSR